ncbi:recombinase RecT [Bacillus sp. S70]|uniref:RecT family recombinase n=1 Tax=unclassified Bacillus (in: firmicutes) TaxID=185979 RepID=UPI00190DBC6E|nr:MULTISPECIES: RecT family recombinase [unclassified Bacillus (in: firmicutes)]MBJ9983625.1 recombinase RecT [Bacillus sp. S29]MBK0104714.1 recombinase RecT [Bacillus sp. S70]MBK0110061.1 recombinase RecT [Bacillus sp. S73]MBK0138841.1 recombinase RecT [Bacillus sp. S72]MBK0148031.1 recombinase RecT [Bacillus sp. S74]
MANQVSATPNTDKVIGNFTKSELDTIKSTIATGTTNEQFALFVQTCVNSELNPFLNHIYCIVYGGKMSIQVSVEGVLHLARQKNGYKGIDVQTVHENDEFEADRSQEGEWIIRKHQVKFPRGKVIGCYAVAQREGFKDVVVMMETDEVIHMKNGTNKHMWNNWFNDMFKKHAMKRAAKLQYGIEINEDEAVLSSPIDNVPAYEPEKRVDITPNKSNQIQVEEGESVDQAAELKKKQSEVMEKLSEYNMTNDDLQEIAVKHFKVPAAELNLQQLTGLVKFLGLEHKKRVKEQEKAQEQPEQEEIDFENMEMEIA